jgi:phytoene synthase
MHAEPTLQYRVPSRDEPALARCFEIATKQSNHLSAAASRLNSSLRYDFFLASYAAMRCLDDLVDVEFLGCAPAEREALRPGVLRRLDRWGEQVGAASKGEYRPREGDLEALVFQALDERLSRSDLGTSPFDRLAASLRRDVEERPLRDWEDFLDYCEGAAVAPGAIFLYLLAAEEDGQGRLHHPAVGEILDEARQLAHYCYLTHIARDLQLDAAREAQLLTVPESWLREAGFSREGFQIAARTGDGAIAPVARRLLAAAEEAGTRAEAGLAGFRRRIPVAHREILDYLFALYRDAHQRVAERWR